MKRRIAMALLLLLVGLSASPLGVTAQAFDLTGLWQDSTGGGAVYRVRQIDDQVYWSVDGTAVGSFANVFVGAIDGTIISGDWVDLPGSPALGGGSLTLRIDSNNHLVKIDESPCCYNAQEWFRQGSAGPATRPSSATARGIDWSYSPQEHRANIGQRYTYTCPPNGTIGTVWGTDVYTDDSSVCTAAVHVGLITLAGGGTVTIEMLADQGAYAASTRNGVSTRDYGRWYASFRFVGGAALPTPTLAGAVEGRNLQIVIESDGTVTLNWRGLSGTTNDWVSIIAAGAADTDFISGQWEYTDRRSAGTFRVRGLPPGEYEARLYLDWPAGGYNVAERLRFRPR